VFFLRLPPHLTELQIDEQEKVRVVFSESVADLRCDDEVFRTVCTYPAPQPTGQRRFIIAAASDVSAMGTLSTFRTKSAELATSPLIPWDFFFSYRESSTLVPGPEIAVY